ncbi:ATP-binding protein [Streptomyces sp. NPDC021562]|uniref:ATP-binding protein n=1 Tax=Streptomyces sp. NPDC021562 TaxID=3155121 RepID=UPI0033D65D6F
MEAPPTTVTVSRTFSQRLSATPRGARLARHLAVAQLHAWGGVFASAEVVDKVSVIVAELAANAVTHGRVPGRDFELRVTLVTGSVRVEVTDTRAERPPAPGAVPPPGPLDDGGRGLLLVDALADRWEVLDRDRADAPGKTVRAEVDLPLRRRRPASSGDALGKTVS